MIRTYDEEIRRACILHLGEWGYDWRLLKAQYWQESRLNPNATSPVGAQGIAQIMPDTWSQWSKKVGYAGENPYDAVASINVGAAYLNHMLKNWYWERPEIDRIALALASYNAGLGNILDAQAIAGYAPLYGDIVAKLHQATGDHAAETLNYVSKIFKYWIKSVEKAEK